MDGRFRFGPPLTPGSRPGQPDYCAVFVEPNDVWYVQGWARRAVLSALSTPLLAGWAGLVFAGWARAADLRAARSLLRGIDGGGWHPKGGVREGGFVWQGRDVDDGGSGDGGAGRVVARGGCREGICLGVNGGGDVGGDPADGGREGDFVWGCMSVVMEVVVMMGSLMWWLKEGLVMWWVIRCTRVVIYMVALGVGVL